MNHKIIAVDFDGTLCENKWPEIGEANKELIAYLKERRAAGDKLILWTCRVGEILQNAVDWSKKQGLIFDAVNENLPEVLEWMGGDSRKIFADEYIDDRNVSVKSCRPKSNMQSWAEREVEIACQHERKESNKKEGEWDYGCSCYKSALKAFNSLCEDDHSGFSIGITKYILNRLICTKVLTPIEDTDDVWNFAYKKEDKKVYQCNRMSSLFKSVYSDGTIEYNDINRFYGVKKDTDITYHSGLIDRVMGELYPIQMPYMPDSDNTKVVCEEFLTDCKNGDLDTLGLLYAVRPGGVRVELNRYFKDSENDFVEIDKEEYEKRRAMHQERLRKEKVND